MPLPSPELAEKLAGYITDRRDKRLITFGVLGAYAAAAIASLAGAAQSKLVLDSLESLATVVVVAHIAGGVAQRAVARGARRKAERVSGAPVTARDAPLLDGAHRTPSDPPGAPA